MTQAVDRPFGTQYPRWRALAAKALRCAITDKWDDAQGAVAEIIGTAGLGADALGTTMVAWIDTTLSRVEVPTDAEGLAWCKVGTNDVRRADEVEPGLRAAGRLFLARHQNDEQRWCDLIAALPVEHHVPCVLAVLDICSSMLVAAGEG